MRWRALGDSAWLYLIEGDDPQARLGIMLRLLGLLQHERIPEVRDLVSSFDSIAVHFDPRDGECVLNWLSTLPSAGAFESEQTKPRHIEVPVAYGADLAEIAKQLERTSDEVVALHSQSEYQVAAIGFSPGFPYLSGLPRELRLPRRTTPRPVEAGTVAIAGEQAGIYPNASQGGWHALGSTGLPLFDPKRASPSLFRLGDRIKFTPAEHSPTGDQRSSRRPAVDSLPSETGSSVETCSLSAGIEVLEPGAITTVQDLGRVGFQQLGVSPGGATDPVAARVANRLVGNPDQAALLECCLSGPVLKFHETTCAAFLGWSHPQAGRPLKMEPGSILDLRGKISSLRGYVALGGGIDVPAVMGSRATDVRAGFGGLNGRKLSTGDHLPLGPHFDLGNEAPPLGKWFVDWPRVEASEEVLVIRVLPGVQASWFTEEAHERFTQGIYQISAHSDRMGIRLEGYSLALKSPREMVSQPVVTGSVQVPPSGQPIVLIAERQTIGGYPQIAHICSADVPKLARAWPGTLLQFHQITLEEARHAWARQESEMGFLQAGLKLFS